MTLENAIRLFTGLLVLFSVTLAAVVSPWFLLIAVFVGLNLVQSVFTGSCPTQSILRRLGVGDDP
jgi:hypothetical protein